MINIKAATAGVLIGLSCYIYQTSPNILGAVMFGLGLVTICECKLPLFTGRVGSSNDLKYLALCFIWNLAGISFMRFMFKYFPYYLAMGIGCGILMQVGVVMYKRNPFITIMCVAAFILAGFKHSIAMFFYDLNWLNWFIVILGNAIGAKMIYLGGVSQDLEK